MHKDFIVEQISVFRKQSFSEIRMRCLREYAAPLGLKTDILNLHCYKHSTPDGVYSYQILAIHL